VPISFVKAHGAGNDFVLIDDLDGRLGPLPPPVVAALCDRHRGIGADGLIRIAPAEGAVAFMDYYNADGGVAEMCGNGVRCLAKYLADRGLADRDELTVDTRAGPKRLGLLRDAAGRVERVRVDMGAPALEAAAIPVAADDPLHVALSADGVFVEAACVSMGNPHAVVFVPALEAVAVGRLGPAIEAATSFPARTNVEFAEVRAPDEIVARVWERGVGETQACGTGACAVLVAAHLRGLAGRRATVRMPGGDLEVAWTEETVHLTGPAVEVFWGTLDAAYERWLLAGPDGRSDRGRGA
jgi:diaminopimelate epimerase